MSYQTRSSSFHHLAISIGLGFAMLTGAPISGAWAQTADTTAKPTTDTRTSVYTLDVHDADDPQLKPVVEGLQKTFQEVYPKLIKRFNNAEKPAPKTIVLTFEKGMNHPAHASGSRLTFSTEWFIAHPDDLACLTHELTHIVQHYPGGGPGWLVEGIADYSRQVFGPNTSWKLPARVAPNDKYTAAYRVTARFLLWVEKKYAPHFVDEANKKLQAGAFKVEDFKTLTGKTVDELWDEYAADTTFKVDPDQGRPKPDAPKGESAK